MTNNKRTMKRPIIAPAWKLTALYNLDSLPQCWICSSCLSIDQSNWIITCMLLPELLVRIQIRAFKSQFCWTRLALASIHWGYFYNASLSPLLLRGAPDTARILYRSFMLKRHRQLQVKNLPKVPTWRLEWDSNPWPFGRKAANLPMSHFAHCNSSKSSYNSLCIDPNAYSIHIHLFIQRMTIPPLQEDVLNDALNPPLVIKSRP